MELVFITGASSGIGAALVELVASLDGHVVATMSRSELDRAHHLSVDLSRPDQWDRAAAWMSATALRAAPTRLTLVHCAAVIEPIGFAGEVDSGLYATNVMLNSASPQVLGERFIGLALELSLPAAVVQISSGAARRAYPGMSSYAAAKAAIDHWTRSVGEERQLRDPAIKVMSIAPGVVATGMQDRIRTTDPDQLPSLDRFMQLKEEGTLREPSDVARDLWAIITDPATENGAVLDLRDL